MSRTAVTVMGSTSDFGMKVLKVIEANVDYFFVVAIHAKNILRFVVKNQLRHHPTARLCLPKMEDAELMPDFDLARMEIVSLLKKDADVIVANVSSGCDFYPIDMILNRLDIKVNAIGLFIEGELMEEEEDYIATTILTSNCKIVLLKNSEKEILKFLQENR